MMQGRYSDLRLVTLVSALGLLVIVGDTFGRSLQSRQVWEQTETSRAQLQAQTDLEVARAEELRRRNEAFQENQVLDVPTLIVQGYILGDPDPPRVDWATSVDPSRRTLIYDQNRSCVGYAYQGNFYSVQDNPKNCEANPHG